MHQYCTTLTREFGPLDLYKKAIMTKILVPYVRGNVCDMGSSYTGLYWSLPTIQNIQSLIFFDIDPKLLDIAPMSKKIAQ